MKPIVGFGIPQQTNTLVSSQAETMLSIPVRSVVEVRFPEDNCTLSYYNDSFDLKPGDLVFVSGKFAGKLGVIKTVTTKFKIRLANYQKIIAKPMFALAGSFRPVFGMMLSEEQNAVPNADLFRSWVKPPATNGQEDEIVCGDGYEFELEEFESDPDVDQMILSRAINYCEEGKIRYLSLKDGVGTAFVEGTLWYEINFSYCDGKISEMYCDCPYPGLCKHNLAVLLMLRALFRNLPFGDRSNFVAVEQSFFWKIISIAKQEVNV